ncbi:MAG: fasciclin domain-containing protein [Actinomycetota bacterium]
MSTRFPRIFVALLALVLVAAACGDDATEDADASASASEASASASEAATEEENDEAMEEESDEAMAEEPGTIVDVAVADGSFTTLVAAVQAAELVDTLSGDGPFTVFAPTDDAFAAALDALGLTAEELLADTETLTSILTYHVVSGEVPSSEVVTLDGASVATVNGAEITIGVDGDTVTVDEATVTAVDVAASNGVIHVIDSVLLPPAG